uniref:Glutathione S-transferase epsilon n=1 Tax=Lasioderma serricorne TaxID=295660 RepID=A0A6B9LSQ3_9COLE|nr:glutathione S-transferase epsilon [Lasioderma serricorne]QWV59555.1 glutathione S-transferase epsilon 3 [Lasioderma serricorne]
MAPQLFIMALTPAVRSVLLTGEALGIKFDIKQLDLAEKREHLTPEYLKINPQHTVPTLIDEDGFVLWDCHAISAYLVEKYGKDDSLYPKDLQIRGTIHQRLHFDTGVLFPIIVNTLRPIAIQGEKRIPIDRVKEVTEAYGFLNKFLTKHRYLSSCHVTIADFNVISSVAVLEIIFPIDRKQFPYLASWVKRMKRLPYYEKTNNGLYVLKEITKSVTVARAGSLTRIK